MARPNDQSGTVIAGRNPVMESLAGSDVRIEKIYLQQGLKGGFAEKLRAAARRAGVPVQSVPPGRLAQMAEGATHQGVVATAAAVTYRDMDEMLTQIAPTMDDVVAQKPILLVLDEIQDPHNFGAILRSAVGAGVAGVIVPERNMAPLSATAIKASAGAALRLPIARAGNIVQAMLQLKERGYWVAGAAAGGERTVWDADWDRPIALVIGSEGRGLRPLVRDRCDYLVAIPLAGPLESLNASVAAGILMFAAARTRTEPER